jgi:hypothetical protein
MKKIPNPRKTMDEDPANAVRRYMMAMQPARAGAFPIHTIKEIRNGIAYSNYA